MDPHRSRSNQGRSTHAARDETNGRQLFDDDESTTIGLSYPALSFGRSLAFARLGRRHFGLDRPDQVQGGNASLHGMADRRESFGTK